MSIFDTAIVVAAVLMIVSGLFCLLRNLNMIKIIIGIEVAMKAVTLLLAYAGYVNGFIALSETFIITVIVIEVVIMVVASGVAVNLHSCYNSMSIRNINKLKG
jgi:multisubunit Na+/H+ antiporter MnhC subunit